MYFAHAQQHLILMMSLKVMEITTRSENGRINAILAKAFNPWVKSFFKDDRRVYKDSRAIYARIAYEMFFRVDPRWKNVDEMFSLWKF